MTELGLLIKVKADGIEMATKNIEGLGYSVEKVEQKVNSTKTAFGGLGKFIGVLASFATIKSIVGLADDYTQLSGRIKNSTESLEEYNYVQKRLEDSAKTTYRSISEATEGFLSFSGSMKALGYNTKQALDVTDSLSFSFTANGARADQARTANDALARSMAMGRIDGRAWMSIMQAADNTAEELAKSMGVTEAEVRRLGATGALSLDDFIQGMIKAKDRNKELADNVKASLGDGFQYLINSISVFVGKMNDTYNITAHLANGLKFVGDNIRTFATLLAGAGVVAFTSYLSSLGGVATITGTALKGLFTIIKAHPFVFIASAIIGLLSYTGELGTAFEALKIISSDVFDVIVTGWKGIADLIEAVYMNMTSTAQKSVNDQSGYFNTYFNDVGSGLEGIVVGFGKVADTIAFLVKGSLQVVGNLFANLWTSVKNGSINTYNFIVEWIEKLVNRAKELGNALIDAANKLNPFEDIEKFEKTKFDRKEKEKYRDFDQGVSDIALNQYNNGLQNYLQNVFDEAGKSSKEVAKDLSGFGNSINDATGLQEIKNRKDKANLDIDKSISELRREISNHGLTQDQIKIKDFRASGADESKIQEYIKLSEYSQGMKDAAEQYKKGADTFSDAVDVMYKSADYKAGFNKVENESLGLPTYSELGVSVKSLDQTIKDSAAKQAKMFDEVNLKKEAGTTKTDTDNKQVNDDKQATNKQQITEMSSLEIKFVDGTKSVAGKIFGEEVFVSGLHQFFNGFIHENARAIEN